MSTTRSCPMGHSPALAQRSGPDLAASASWIVPAVPARAPAASSRAHESRVRGAMPAVGGWWAFCTQASSVEVLG